MFKSFVIAVIAFTLIGYGVVHLAISLAERAQDSVVNQRR